MGRSGALLDALPGEPDRPLRIEGASDPMEDHPMRTVLLVGAALAAAPALAQDAAPAAT